MAPEPIKALLPNSDGHQFVMYGDSCSGVPNALYEGTFAAVNAVLKRLTPQPEFILFPGDEIIGLTPDPVFKAAVETLARPPQDADVAYHGQSHDIRRDERGYFTRNLAAS